MTKPEAGETWREVDPRFTRHVKVLEVAEDKARVQTLGDSTTKGRWVKISRFNGKRGGYEKKT